MTQMEKTELRATIIRAVRTGNAELLGRAVERLRNMGIGYQDCYRYVASVAPIDIAEYDSLLYEADEIDAGGGR